MINFRYHIVSLIAVFLALGIGIIMGTAVIDRAVVDRLERQQRGLQSDVDQVQAENDALQDALGDERATSQQLAEEGSARLLDGVLAGVPVILLGSEGADAPGIDALRDQIVLADADYRGTLRLTERFVLDDEEERRDLATVLDLRTDATAGTLRATVVNRLGASLRPVPGDGPVPGPDPLLAALREAGFVDFDAPEGASDDTLPALVAGLRVVLFTGPGAAVPDKQLLVPLASAFSEDRPTTPGLPVLAVTARPEVQEDGEEQPGTLVEPIREEETVAARVSTVDDIDDFAGRLAAVLALADLGEGRTGHYGRGPGAQRLLPPPAE